LWIRRWHWTFFGVLLHCQGAREWIQLPGREWTDAHGNTRFAAIGRFDNDEITAALRELGVAAIKQTGGNL
jgi:hypothetical protein